MNTLAEILEEVAEGRCPDYDELRYALLAMSKLRAFDHMAIMKLAQAKREGKTPILTRCPEHQFESSFNRYKAAMNVDPKTWLGPDNDPDTERGQRTRQFHKSIIKKVTGD